ncbi:MAG: DUF3109 family protein [Marinilabiliaceae bacterium]|nr:DUF3109 family protein [Marinilabiliaceae bacterium]
MLQIQNTIISLEVFEQFFVCDLSNCGGICCVHGVSGAPLEDDETIIIEQILPIVFPFLNKSAQKVIEKKGAWTIDFDNDKVTPLNNGQECVYAILEENICKCAFEMIYEEGLTDFIKPISCHLYPIRITKYKNFEAMNYHSWQVCEAARNLGKKSETALFHFLKEAIIRKYGETFFKEMKVFEKEYRAQVVT